MAFCIPLYPVKKIYNSIVRKQKFWDFKWNFFWKMQLKPVLMFE